VYHEYNALLEEAGIKIPENDASIVEVPGRPVTIYIAQKRLPLDSFVHKRIHTLDDQSGLELITGVIDEISKVWDYHFSGSPSIELALDGQLSNWACPDSETDPPYLYVDTSTPLYRKDGKEQLDPELLLQSAPSFLRWILRLFFLEGVINRYYDQRSVCIDLIANLYKEQRPDMIPNVIDRVNHYFSGHFSPLTMEEINKYYKEDKLIWTLFLTFRRIDRWLMTKILRKRYEFILPGKIKR
jgi:hypothetical protein